MIVEKEERREISEKSEVFSHSKLCLFENCPEAYKIKYIDKKWPDVPKSIELFLGDYVHQSLEWLYHEVKKRKVELDELVEHFVRNWADNFKPEIRVKRDSMSDCYHKGIKFLIDYYQTNFPFDENTVDIEREIWFNLDSGGKYKVRGFIDRIVLNDKGEYEVHDYKTNKFPKTQEQADADRQLAFYHLGLKEIFGNVKVKLVWHFLAHNKKVVSQREDVELEKLKAETLELIKKIENNKEWKACGKAWCDWCAYKKKYSLERFF